MTPYSYNKQTNKLIAIAHAAYPTAGIEIKNYSRIIPVFMQHYLFIMSNHYPTTLLLSV